VDITARCPQELRQDDVCNKAFPVFIRDAYSCVGSAANNCGPTNYSRLFKGLCPDAYNYTPGTTRPAPSPVQPGPIIRSSSAVLPLRLNDDREETEFLHYIRRG
jgi:hypothetical protein